ncbi:MAG: cell division protein ZapA [Treponema sp.]|jgi:cell division protein ZapA (FtsZ GTPase activity inhibitor)|nr:cell division protein ZapA [Treponema sp.]
MSKSDLRIDILGASFSITADEDPVYLENLLNRYRLVIENTKKITGLEDPLKVSIIAGFLLCDELEKKTSPGSGAYESKAAEELTLDLITRLDKALNRF